MKRFLSTSFLYLILTAFIASWWMLAFRTTHHSFVPASNDPQTLALKTSQLLQELSPFQRETLKEALSGNFQKMVELIDAWDQDATTLAHQGIVNVEHLPPEQYLQAHLIGYLLQHSSPETIRSLNCKMNLDAIRDDSGRLLKIEDDYKRFLPQTFAAASFLLAIAQPHEIIALPKGMRHLSQIYRAETLSLIPGNIDRTHSEKLYLAKPDLAFVAPYSHPPALEVLYNQKIKLYTIKYFDSLSEIQEALLKIGHASNHILEAQLLAIFIEAAFLSIDNRLLSVGEKCQLDDNPLHALFLDYHQHFAQPTSKCLTGQLIARAASHCSHLSCPIPESQEDWRVPFEQEELLQSDPDCLLISTPHLSNSPSLPHQLKAYQRKQVYYLDEAIQESPTQYLVLAYYDIYQALTVASLEKMNECL